jgi:Acyl-CoA thioester hydrolase/BAAT N-terminal region
VVRPIAAGLLGVSLAIAAGVRPLAAQAPQPVQSVARFELPRQDVLIDDTIPIVVSGLMPGATATVRLRSGQDGQWTSSATFTADDRGSIDLTRMAPVKGSYKDADAMGLFWSAERRGATSPPRESDRESDREIDA